MAGSFGGWVLMGRSGKSGSADLAVLPHDDLAGPGCAVSGCEAVGVMAVERSSQKEFVDGFAGGSASVDIVSERSSFVEDGKDLHDASFRCAQWSGIARPLSFQMERNLQKFM